MTNPAGSHNFLRVPHHDRGGRHFQRVAAGVGRYQGRRHTFLAGGGGRISAVSFGSDQWNGICFYGTDKYVNWLRSV